MRDITYARATNVADALQRGAAADTAFLGGGTSLVDLMKLEVLRPAHVVDVTHLPLGNVEVTADGVRVGALVTNSALARHAEVHQRAPVLSQALRSGAS